MSILKLLSSSSSMIPQLPPFAIRLNVTIRATVFLVLGILPACVTGYAYHGDNAGLTAVPENMPEELLTVYLSWNQIRDIKPGIFTIQNYCRWMWLNDNSLTEIRPDMWIGLRGLLELYLFNNKISDLKPGAFKHLGKVHSIWLWQNELTVIRPDMWEGLKSLKRLYLEDNKIETIRPGGFTTLPNLEKLDYLGLIDNKLTTLPDDILSIEAKDGTPHRPDNLTLTLQDNPFQCDSRLCWLQTAEQQGWINFYYFYSYVSPGCANLPGIAWEEIHMDCD